MTKRRIGLMTRRAMTTPTIPPNTHTRLPGRRRMTENGRPEIVSLFLFSFFILIPFIIVVATLAVLWDLLTEPVAEISIRTIY